MVDITGTVSACSHSFWLSSRYVMLLKLDIEGKTEHIVVEEPKLQEWHQLIKVWATYSFKCMHPDKIDLGSQCMHVFQTCSHSTLEQLKKKEQLDQMKEHYRAMQSKTLSCKATIREVIDAEAGIYLLSNNMKLYITFIKDLTGELWSEGHIEDTADAKVIHCLRGSSCSTSRDSSLSKCCLRLGDSIEIWRCHIIRKEETIVLVCCGQSHIVNESRKFVLRTSAAEGRSWVTTAVHSLNLGFWGLLWLLKLKDEILYILQSLILKKSAAAGVSIITSFLDEAKKRIMEEKKPRSLLEEFLQPNHRCNCGLMQNFTPPFELATLKNILLDQARNDSLSSSRRGCQVRGEIRRGWNQESDLWSYSVNQKENPPSVLLGELIDGHCGVLQLKQTEGTMDLVVVGNAGMMCSKFGSTVALFNYYVIKEKFFKINDADAQKLYIVLKDSDLFLLEEPKAEPSAAEESQQYKLKLLSKSAIAFQCKPRKELNHSQYADSKFFWGMSTIMKMRPKGEVLEKWQRFVKFSRENANLYPILEVGDECDLEIPPFLNPEIVLKKSQVLPWMQSILENECLCFPNEIHLTKVFSERIRCGAVSVQEIKREGHHSELITVSGNVLCKTFVSPMYKSEANELPSAVCNEHHIGVPSGMNFRIWLQDETDSDCKVWLYVTCSTNFFIKGYPLFVIPGVRILATDVSRVVTKNNGNVYLKSSYFSRIVPLSVLETEQTCQADAPSRLTETMYCTLSNVSSYSKSSFVIFARVIKIVTGTLKLVCKYCEYDIVELYPSCANCFGSSPADIKVSLEVCIDDGTDTALIILKDLKKLAVLLGLSKKEYAKLYKVTVTGRLQFNYSATASPVNNNCKVICSNTEAFKMMITHADLAHSYRFLCIKQDSQPYLCLDMSPLNPIQDVDYL